MSINENKALKRRLRSGTLGACVSGPEDLKFAIKAAKHFGMGKAQLRSAPRGVKPTKCFGNLDFDPDFLEKFIEIQ